MEYECVTHKVLFRDAVLATLMSGRKYDIPQHCDCSRESNVHTSFFKIKSVIKQQRRYRTQYGKAPPLDNTILRWLRQFQQTGIVLHQKGAGKPSTSEENVARIQEAFSLSPKNQLNELLCS
jgi:hypothetical protein